MEYELRDESPEDADFLERLFVDARGAEFALGGIPEPMLQQLLAMQAKAQRMGYGTSYPGARWSVIWVDGERAGRVIVHEGSEVTTLVDVALSREYRGRGIGTALIQGICRGAGARRVRLSVNRSNPAQKLYLRCGFRVCGEDAIRYEMEYVSREDSGR